MNVFPKIAFNTLIQIIGRGVVIGLTIITTALLTRRLGVAGYGDYVFITAFLMFFSSMADWGTGIISVREASQHERRERIEERIYGNALLLRLAIAIFSFFLINLLIFILPQFSGLILPAVIASTLLLFWSLRTSCQIIFQTKLRFDQHALVEVFSSGLFVLFLVLVLRFSSDLTWIFLALSSASFLAALLALILGRRLTDFDFQPDWQLMKRIVKEALPTGALLLVFSIYNRLDIFLLQSIKGAEPVGIYGLAYKVHDNLVLGAAFLANAFFPVISRYGKISELEKGFQPMREIYQKLFDILFIAGLVMAVLVLIFSPLIIQIIGGQEFSASILVLRILVLGTFVAYFNHLTGYSLIALGKQKVSLAVAVVALVWNISLNLFFIPRFSYLAAAYITIATEGLVLALTSLYLARKFNLKPAISFHKNFVEIIKKRGKIF
jgi:O-antigen/teichoic acid export membrane protein